MLYVYFIQAGEDGPIKIGISDDPERRRGSMQTDNPVELRLLAARPSTARLEKILHRAFAPGHIRGEWFRSDTPGLRDEIRRAQDMELAVANGHDRFCSHCGQPVYPPRTRVCGARCERDRKRKRSVQWRQERRLAVSLEGEGS